MRANKQPLVCLHTFVGHFEDFFRGPAGFCQEIDRVFDPHVGIRLMLVTSNSNGTRLPIDTDDVPSDNAEAVVAPVSC